MPARFEDTIAARATPEGLGAVAVVRVSGPHTRALVEEAVRFGGRPAWERPRRMLLGRVLDGQGRLLDQALVCFMPAPRTYTGEDMAELHGHGGRAAAAAVLERLLELGARPALPGEFTRRAFENGRISLDQAEAVARMVEAGSRAELLGAARALEGELGDRLALAQDQIEEALARLEAGIEFPEEQDVQGSLVDLSPSLLAVSGLCSAVRKRGGEGSPRVVVTGRPNAGKSSIINKITGKHTALVTPQPGTTRDAVAAEVMLSGQRLELVDTAGREPGPDDRVPAVLGPAGPADVAAVRRAREQAEGADLVLWVTGADLGEEDALRRDLEDGLRWIQSMGRRGLGVLHKIDRLPPAWRDRLGAALGGRVLLASARTGEGMEALEGRVCAELERALGPVDGLPLSARQAEALRRIQAALGRAAENLQAGGAELAAEDLREALDGVGLLCGQGLEPDVLGRIFEVFCIGK